MNDNDLIRRGDARDIAERWATDFQRQFGAGGPASEIRRLPAAQPQVTVKPLIYTIHDRGNIGVCIGGRWHGWTMIQHPDGYWVSDHMAGAVDPAQSGVNSILAAISLTPAPVDASWTPDPVVKAAARVLLDNPSTLHAALSRAMPNGYSTGHIKALRDLAGDDK